MTSKRLSGADSELMSVFSVEDNDDEDSEDDYYPWSLSGKTLQEVESPYDKHTRILQANRQLFSQPSVRKKHPNKVKFDLVPRLVEMNEVGEVIAETQGLPLDHNITPDRIENIYKRRQTPMILPPQLTLNTVSPPPQNRPTPPGSITNSPPRTIRRSTKDKDKQYSS